MASSRNSLEDQIRGDLAGLAQERAELMVQYRDLDRKRIQARIESETATVEGKNADNDADKTKFAKAFRAAYAKDQAAQAGMRVLLESIHSLEEEIAELRAKLDK